jgi:hypothetical protein
MENLIPQTTLEFAMSLPGGIAGFVMAMLGFGVLNRIITKVDSYRVNNWQIFASAAVSTACFAFGDEALSFVVKEGFELIQASIEQNS